MKSLYESIRNIMTEAPAQPAQPAPGSPAAKSMERGQALKNWFKGESEGQKALRRKAEANAKPIGDKSFADTQKELRDRAVKNAMPPEKAFPAPKAEVPATKTGTKAPMTAAATIPKPAKQTSTASTPKADNAPTSNDAPKPAAMDASSLAKAQGKETSAEPDDRGARAMASMSAKPEAEPDDRGARAMATPSKRASILPADTMAKQIASTRDTVNKAFGNDNSDDEESKPQAAKVETPKAEEPKAETPKANDKDYSTGRPADKELDTKYGKGNTRTDADGRTYVRQKGVMGGPDTENRSYASVGDFINKIRGKGNVNGKVTTEESYVNKTFSVSKDLVADIMEVMKKKEGSIPRNDKEEDLAAQHGDPKRITHGDVLVARGVVKSNSPVKMGKKAIDVEEGMSSKMKMKLGLYNKKKIAVKENKDTPGNSYEHQCAIHVKSESFGEGRTVTTQHAEPDQDGNIAWYDVMFEHGIEKHVPTSDLEILVSEMHMHSKRKKTVKEANDVEMARAADARTNAQIAKMRERARQGLGFNVGTIDTKTPEQAAFVQGDTSGVSNAAMASQTDKPAAPAPAAKPAAPAATPAPAPAPVATANKPMAAAVPALAPAATPAPAGETPEEKAKKAAAAKPLQRSNSFSGQGMVGTDY